MKTRLIVPLLLGAVLFSLPAMATGKAGPKGSGPGHPREHIIASMDPATKCRLLNEQFNVAIRQHEDAAMATQAKAMRSEGLELCAQFKQEQGAAKLEEALRDIDVRPWG